MAKQTICDYCGRVIKEPFHDYRGDLDSDCLVCLDVKITSLNSSKGNSNNPDLCRECIINVLRG